MTNGHEDPSVGRLQIGPPGEPTGPPLPPGTRPLGLGGRRDGLVVVPRSLDPQRPAPLVVVLHGAGGSGRQMTSLLAHAAQGHGAVLVAPDSRAATWDVIRGGYGPDVLFVGEAVAHVGRHLRIDPARMTVCGFSDGASYAVSLGIGNGDLFTAVMAYSPGFATPVVRHGTPRMFVSHGVRDDVLPVGRCSRRLVPRLRESGYDVTYVEFPDGHQVPEEIVDRSFAWLRGGDDGPGTRAPTG